MRRCVFMTTIVALVLAIVANAALAQDEDVPEDLEDQPIACSEGVDCPGDPGYVPLPGEEEPPQEPDISDEAYPKALPPGVELIPNPPDKVGQAPSPEGTPPLIEGVPAPRPGPPASTPGPVYVGPSSTTPRGDTTQQQAPRTGTGGGSKAKELPRTGGTGGVALLALGVGSLLVGGGLLLHRTAR